MITLSNKLLKQLLNRKWKCVQSMQDSALEHSIFVVTILTTNFGCYQFKIMPEIVSRLCSSVAQPSEKAVLLD